MKFVSTISIASIASLQLVSVSGQGYLKFEDFDANVESCSYKWSQCDGQNWDKPTCCEDYDFECKPSPDRPEGDVYTKLCLPKSHYYPPNAPTASSSGGQDCGDNLAQCDGLHWPSVSCCTSEDYECVPSPDRAPDDQWTRVCLPKQDPFTAASSSQTSITTPPPSTTTMALDSPTMAPSTSLPTSGMASSSAASATGSYTTASSMGSSSQSSSTASSSQATDMPLSPPTTTMTSPPAMTSASSSQTGAMVGDPADGCSINYAPCGDEDGNSSNCCVDENFTCQDVSNQSIGLQRVKACLPKEA